MMYRSILVPLDGSPFAEAALPPALRLAQSAHAALHLVLAHEPVVVPVGLDGVLLQPEGDTEALWRRRAYLTQVADDTQRPGMGVDFREVAGPAGPAVCEEATRLESDLVVMATHGRGAMGRLWLGSVADYLIRHLSIPVLLIHPNRRNAAPAKPALRSILVALDLSRDSEAILETVTALAQLTQGHVTLIHNLPPVYAVAPNLPYPVPIDQEIVEENRVRAQRRLDQLADRLRCRGVSVATRITGGASTAGALLEELEKAPFDLLAMATHGKRGLGRLLLGNVADKVIRGAGKPVLVIRPFGAR